MKQTTLELQAELEAVIDWFESDVMDIDKASKQYERGLKIAKELQARLEETKNTIIMLKTKFDT
jgi:exodeoxyribonuclease VII small subunit